jgi:hypothetical protein
VELETGRELHSLAGHTVDHTLTVWELETGAQENGRDRCSFKPQSVRRTDEIAVRASLAEDRADANFGSGAC